MYDLDPIDRGHGGPQREEQRERPLDAEVDRICSQAVHSRPAFSINTPVRPGEWCDLLSSVPIHTGTGEAHEGLRKGTLRRYGRARTASLAVLSPPSR